MNAGGGEEGESASLAERLVAGAQAGPIDPGLREQLPGLLLRQLVVERGSGRSSKALRQRLARLSDRVSGAQAINLRAQAIPWAYRVFFHHIGLDPDQQRTPVEALVLERLLKGGFPSGRLPDDALTVAIVESGVALMALDAEGLELPVGMRPSRDGERLRGASLGLVEGTLVLADRLDPVALPFGEVAAPQAIGRRSKRTLLIAIGVKGVPDVAVEEALWLATEALLGG